MKRSPSPSSYVFRLLILVILFSLACSAAASVLSFAYPNLGTFTGVGNTSTFSNAGYVELTISDNDPSLSAGHLFYPDNLSLWSSSTHQFASFNCSFQFEILKYTNCSSPPCLSGDGLAFVLLKPDSPDVLNTSKGQWLGLFNESTNGTDVGVIAVEFDTYENFFDPNANHIGINVNSIVSNVTQPTLGFTLASSDRISSWVDYSGSQALLEVYAASLSDIKPDSPLLSLRINLSHYLPEYVRIGFSASTGSGSEYHRLRSWSFNSSDVKVTTRGHTNGVVIGVGVSVPTFLVLAAVAGLLGWRRRRQTQRPSQSDWPTMQGPVEGLREFTHKELFAATGNFGERFLLGQGGFGDVHRGVLRQENGSKLEVAVKRILRTSDEGKRGFFAEVSIISRILHKNLVRLKGWCRHESELFLVYEYLPNGSLDKHLFKTPPSEPLDWEKRYKIVCGVGSGLQYLHQQCEKVIVHRDIKSSNVLLDTNYNAKLGDFGLARQLQEGVNWHSTNPLGTRGYMAPEIVPPRARATPESDVFSYGILLLEVACGRRPLLPSGSLRDWVWELHSQGRLIEACDSRLEGRFAEEELVRTLSVGLSCSLPDPIQRPTIRSALEALEGRAPLPPFPPSPNSSAPPYIVPFLLSSPSTSESGLI